MNDKIKHFLFLVLMITTSILAQNITNKLGGATENEKFKVTDNNDNLKFVVRGDGKVGIGTNPVYELDVVGDINCTGNIYQNGVPASEHYIGELYGGGIVFYVFFNPNDGQQHGLIASLDDIDGGNGIAWWNGANIVTNAISPWDGASNTNLIINTQGAGTYAASICDDYSGGGETDWFLPAIWQLSLLFNNAFLINNILERDGDNNTNGLQFGFKQYWSSTERVENDAYMYDVRYSNTDVASKNNNDKKVRAIRTF